MTNAADSDLLIDIDGPIAWITVNRPRSRNSMTLDMYRELTARAGDLARRSDVRVVVLRGAGGAFISGTDIRTFLEIHNDEDVLAYEQEVVRTHLAIDAIPVPVIAAISGPCTGGGAAIAACCDLRIGTTSATFGIPIARTLGNLVSGALFARLAFLIGPSQLARAFYTADLIDAQSSLTIGWLHEVVPDDVDFDVRTDELAQQIAELAPLTLRSVKIALRRQREAAPHVDIEDLMLECYRSADHHNAARSFLTKQKPTWTGK